MNWTDDIHKFESREIVRIIIHCTASDFGDVNAVRQWHIDRGFSDIGYHYLILNGRRTPFMKYTESDDGKIELGRPWWRQGAHTKGENYDSLGICLVGNPKFIGAPEMWFSERQLQSLRRLVSQLMDEFDIPVSGIHGHNEYAPKLCPGFRVELIKGWWK
ncbi:N-acetylmuramoyl-L-alanine amidase [bacterium]|nr:MAG: N-acetylmuramoyl-L-alanine amidase [bacterium]